MGRGTNDGVPAIVRRQRMLELIGEHGFARVSELSDAFEVSDVTVRSDLDILDEHRAIRRVHGGAVLRGGGAGRELSFEESLESSAAASCSMSARRRRRSRAPSSHERTSMTSLSSRTASRSHSTSSRRSRDSTCS
jgi:predicted DNA-binding transcriptional regulator YafY